jgi:hypothetical protein
MYEINNYTNELNIELNIIDIKYINSKIFLEAHLEFIMIMKYGLLFI